VRSYNENEGPCQTTKHSSLTKKILSL